jgi:hypothetical protein
MLLKLKGEILRVEIELTPLLSAVQDILGYRDHLPIDSPGLERALDYSMAVLQKEYDKEVEALFRKQAKETGSITVLEDD